MMRDIDSRLFQCHRARKCVAEILPGRATTRPRDAGLRRMPFVIISFRHDFALRRHFVAEERPAIGDDIRAALC